MFFEPERIPKIRKMILFDTAEQREEALAELLPFQKGDFKAMYEALEGRPMTVRYLDPPLHEFVPTDPVDIEALAKDMGMTPEEVQQKCDELHEFNPMMGHRGCRLAATYYYGAKIYESDPFARLDQSGVGQLIQLAAQNGRATRPDIKMGICGEHGGDSSSVAFCHKVGLNYVSCSPFRVPIARLAAAQATLEDKSPACSSQL